MITLTPEQIAELRAALAKATPGPWRTFAGINDDGVWAACGPEHEADYDADETNEPGDVAEQAAQRDAELIALMRNALPSLLDAAERCARLSESIGLKFNGESVAVPAIDIIENVAVQLASAIARAEAAEKERDRMRPVVEAAVAEYRAADAANDETEPDDTQVQRNGRWAKAETTLHIAVHNYLDGDHAKGGG